MTTVNNFVDILRIIREQPEWREALRSALLSEDVLEMPQRLAELAATVREFSAATEKRLAALETDVTDLKDGQARLESKVSNLEDGQARLEGKVSNLEDGQARLESKVSNLEDGQARLERSFSRLEGEVGNLKGDAYELKVGNHIYSLIGQHTDVMPVRVLKGSRAPNDMAFLNPIYEAKNKGIITEQDRVAAFAVDIVVEGRRASEQSTLYVVLEISRTIGDSDINRAAARADIVHRATGKQAVPAVIGVLADDVRRRHADERGVTLIVYG